MLAKLQEKSIDGLSARYRHVNSLDVHKVLADHGFVEKGYRQSHVYKPEREGFQKHFSVFHRPEMQDGGNGNFNVMLFNAHDGTAAIRLELGYFRFICENQLVNAELGFKVAHTGNVLERLNQRIPMLLKGYEDFRGLKERLEGVNLDMDQIHYLVDEALRLRELDGADIEDNTMREHILTYNRRAMNYARRSEDISEKAWQTLNRIQENVIKGTKWDFMNQTEKGSTIFRKLRPVTNMERVVKFNKALTEKVVELVGAA